MARIRSIKPQFFKDPDLAELPVEARMFYAGLWCQADREGRLRDEPKLLKVEIAPYDDVDAEATLNILAAPRTTSSGETKPGFITRYEVRGRRYIWIPRFLKHQKPHHKETASEIPPPPGAPTESGPAPAQTRSNPVDSGFLFPDQGEKPPVAPREEPGGPPGTVLRLPRIRKRPNRKLSLAEQREYEVDELRDERSKLLDGQLRLAPMNRDEQLRWVQIRCHASPEEAADVVAIVEEIRRRRAPS